MAGNDAFTTSLLHFETDFSDSNAGGSAKTWTVNGTVTIGVPPFAPPFGTNAVLFDGSTGSLTTPDHADWNSQGDYTIDFWYLLPATPVAGVFDKGNDNNTPWSIKVFSGLWRLWMAATDFSFITSNSSMANIVLNQWRHLEIDKSGNDYYVFDNGTVSLQFSSAKTPMLNANTVTMGVSTGLNYYNGWIKEFRFSKGIARHVANFTPPVAPYSAPPPPIQIPPEQVKSTSIINLDAFPMIEVGTGEGAPGVMISVNDSVTSKAGMLTSSSYRICRFPSHAKLKCVLFTCAAHGGSAAFDINIAHSDDVVDGTPPEFQGNIVKIGSSNNRLFGASVSAASAQKHLDVTFQNIFTSAHKNMQIWQALANLGAAFTQDPGGFFDIVLTSTAIDTNGGNLEIQVFYVV